MKCTQRNAGNARKFIHHFETINCFELWASASITSGNCNGCVNNKRQCASSIPMRRGAKKSLLHTSRHSLSAAFKSVRSYRKREDRNFCFLRFCRVFRFRFIVLVATSFGCFFDLYLHLLSVSLSPPLCVSNFCQFPLKGAKWYTKQNRDETRT